MSDDLELVAAIRKTHREITESDNGECELMRMFREAAQGLLKVLQAPSWTLSVEVRKEEDKIYLLVNVDPRYRMPEAVPAQYEGFPVVVRWRPQAVAFSVSGPRR